MTKRVQLQDLDNNENVYPLTDIDAVDGLEERLKAVEDREDKDTIFDPSDIEKRLDALEASGGDSYDDSELRGRIEVLEEKEDKDTVYDDTELKNRVGTLESDVAELKEKEDKDTVYDDSELRGRIEDLEKKEDKDTVYDDTELRERIGALESGSGSGDGSYNDTELRNRVGVLETDVAELKEKEDKDTVYDDTVLKGRIEDLESDVEELKNKEDKDTVYNDSELRERIGALEAGSGTGDGSYNDSELRGRIVTLESDVNELKGREDKDTVYDDSELRGRIEDLESNQGTGGDTYDDAELKKWISDTYIVKGTDTNSLVQVDGNGRAIFDNDSFADAGVGTQIPTVRSIKTELSQYVKTGEIDLDGYVTSESLSSDLTNLKSEILGGAGEDYNTLKKIEEWVEEHQDLYQALISTISEKAGKDEIADMATQTYVEGEVETLVEELNKKFNVVVCDNQYEFDQILTKDNNTIYLIKGDQDQWFSKSDGDELYDFYGELLERVKELERLNGITEYGDENNE